MAGPTLIQQYMSSVQQSAMPFGPGGMFPPGTIWSQFTNAPYYSNHGVKSYRPIWYGGPCGGRVHAITALAGNGTPNFIVGRASLINPPGSITGLTKNGTNDTITRSAAWVPGSFLLDGWQAGQTVMVCNNQTTGGNATASSNTDANPVGYSLNNVIQQIASLTASTLTLEGQNDFTGGSDSNATTNGPSTPTFLLRPTILSGSIACGTTPTNIATATNLPQLFSGADEFITLGPNEFLIGFFDAAPTAPAGAAVNPPHQVVVDGGWY